MELGRLLAMLRFYNFAVHVSYVHTGVSRSGSELTTCCYCFSLKRLLDVLLLSYIVKRRSCNGAIDKA